jgi:hypothetical protein
MIAELPDDNGAVHETTTCALPATPDTLLGGLGTEDGVIEEEGEEGSELPATFLAVTVNV